jgi:hypothetical protein
MKKVTAFFDFVTNRNFISLLVLILVMVISIQTYLLGPREWQGVTYTHYNNYKIFTSSFWHLVEQQDLYAGYPDDHYDLYKYSPTFSVLMAPFAVLPDWLGLLLWNFLNAFILLFAIYKLPQIERKTAGWIILLVVFELVISLRNNQSNALMAGLVILAFSSLEKNRPAFASFLLALSFFIKLFSLPALSLALLYPTRYRFGFYFAGWVAILGILPLAIIPFEQMAFLYQSWWELLAGDQSVYYGISVMGWLNSWFGIEMNKNLLILLGAVVFMIPFLFIKSYTDDIFRVKLLASVLLWMVIFNHMAESPTYIIAMTGAGVWFFTSRRNWLDISLLILAIVLTSLSMTDLTPNAWKNSFIKPYVLKAIPCILIWLKIQTELIWMRGVIALSGKR